jgi:hypothetical protein
VVEREEGESERGGGVREDRGRGERGGGGEIERDRRGIEKERGREGRSSIHLEGVVDLMGAEERWETGRRKALCFG